MAGSSWTIAEDALLREKWGKVKSRQIAAEMGRSMLALKQRAGKLGLNSGRRFTEEQKAKVRQMYPTHTAAQIAKVVFGDGRGAMHVFRLAAKLGLQKWPSWSPAIVGRVRELHGQGLHDYDIAAAMKMNRDQVYHLRHHRMKLSANAAAVLEARRRGQKTQLKKLGVKNTAELRSLKYRHFAEENGWPSDCRPREVQILNVLAAAGVPMTRLEIAEKIGMRTDRMGANGTLALLTGNGPGGNYTASLLRRGLLEVMKRASPGPPGKALYRRSRDLYYLGPAAIKLLEARSCTEMETAAGL